jgi:hypothetical protein
MPAFCAVCKDGFSDSVLCTLPLFCVAWFVGATRRGYIFSMIAEAKADVPTLVAPVINRSRS